MAEPSITNAYKYIHNALWIFSYEDLKLKSIICNRVQCCDRFSHCDRKKKVRQAKAECWQISECASNTVKQMLDLGCHSIANYMLRLSKPVRKCQPVDNHHLPNSNLFRAMRWLNFRVELHQKCLQWPLWDHCRHFWKKQSTKSTKKMESEIHLILWAHFSYQCIS